KKTIGLLDARYVGEPNYMAATGVAPAYPYATIDPSYVVGGVFVAAMNRYLREELKSRSDLPYEALSEPTGQAWDSGTPLGYLYTGDNLRAAMTENEKLKVFVAAGRYDLVTTATAARYQLNHLGLSPALRGNLTLREYEGGHMMYLVEAELAKLKADLATFYAAAAPAKGK
ncbi:MAG TPA: peptidase S10, partial [Thermoanaerobaculia bacterium]